MSQPAARLTDMHVCGLSSPIPHVGGPIMGPGVPTVMIGGLPAANVGTTAMCAPPAPPDTIIPPGSPTVLIGGMPAARLGDVTAHGGTITLGCFTVLIGSAGAAGSGTGGVGAFAGAASESGGSPCPPPDCMMIAKQLGSPFIAIQKEVVTDEVRSVENARWGQEKARRGEIVTLGADTKGFDRGTEATLRIYEYDRDGNHDFITSFTTEVKDNRVEAEWEFEYHEDTDEIPTAEESEKGYNPPEYFFEVFVEGESAQSDESELLEFRDWIEIELLDENDEPIANVDYVLTLPDGNEKRGTLDANGRAKEEDIPPGKCFIEFPDLGEETESDESHP